MGIGGGGAGRLVLSSRLGGDVSRTGRTGQCQRGDHRRGFVRLKVKDGARWEWANLPVQAPPYLDALLQESDRERERIAAVHAEQKRRMAAAGRKQRTDEERQGAGACEAPRPVSWHPGRRTESSWTSQACPHCSRLGERFSPDGRGYPSRFRCGHCGWTGDANIVAALNLQRKWDRTFRYPSAAEKQAVEARRRRKAGAAASREGSSETVGANVRRATDAPAA